MRRLLLVVLLGLLLWFGRTHFGNAPVNVRSTEVVSVEVPAGLSARAIARKLRAAGVLRSPLGFTAQVAVRGARRELQAGTYAFSPRESGSTILQRLRRGDTLPEDRVVTFPEGFTLAQMAERLEAQGVARREEFLAGARADRFRSEFSFLRDAPDGSSLEGYLFPDTYRWFPDSPADAVIRRMLRRFGERFARAQEVSGQESDVGSDVRLPTSDVPAIVTMASIIEREVRTPEDRRLVSGILWKRFTAGIGLDADATIRYALNKWEGRLTANDLRLDSPYNTRRYRGLPPGPIGNPGLESLRAALAPQESEFLYYLSAVADKRTIFSKTLEEHARAKAEYLR